MQNNNHSGLLSTSRIVGLASCIIVAVASGTNYVFSAYGPQLASRLALSHTQLNVISLSSTVGVYGTAPFMGKLVDYKGPKPLLLISFVCLLVGYLGMRQYYISGLPPNAAHLSVFSFLFLVVLAFFSGLGGNGGIMAAMNATAKSWPDSARATTTGLVLSGFGLSAFMFSTIARTFFPGETSTFLLVLAIGTAIPMLIGLVFIRPIPLPIQHDSHDPERSRSAHPDDSHTPLLASLDPELDPHQEVPHSDTLDSIQSAYEVPESTHSLRLTRSRDNTLRDSAPISLRSASQATQPNIHGLDLFKSADFWLLFTITILLSGTGLMYINNVGSMTQALYARTAPIYDELRASQWQATQVSTISVVNCIGRILLGLIADSSKRFWNTSRSVYISLVASLFVISQLVAYSTTEISQLWKASALLGLSYGSMFGLFPAISIEWFGLKHFSENWGIMSLAPVIGSNILSLAFGRILDAHSPSESDGELVHARDPPPPPHARCMEGRDCYVDSLKLTLSACLLALVLAMYAGFRDHHKHRQRS